MNEVFERLGKEAHAFAAAYSGSEEKHLIYRQKYNELIVQECANIADDGTDDLLWVGKLIKEHFGVH